MAQTHLCTAAQTTLSPSGALYQDHILHVLDAAMTCASAGYEDYSGGTLQIRFDETQFPDMQGTLALCGAVILMWAAAWAVRSLRGVVGMSR